MKPFLRITAFLFLISCTSSNEPARLPNVVIFLADDLGYGDLGCYGNRIHQTPHIDRLAASGMRLTDFYVAASVCTPTRAALMTGCYPRRIGLHRDSKDHCVLIPGANKGLNPSEITLAEMFQKQGYATGCFGKWHLGDQKVFLPTRHGFDVYYGVPYSNDMAWKERGDPPLPILMNEEIIESGTRQDSLTWKTTTQAMKFILRNCKQPFFTYIPFNMPHNPVHASKNFSGRSKNGMYGDAIEEIDYSVGRIVDLLDSLHVLENTIILFTSDNGAARSFGGSNNPLSGWKGGNLEGGFRVPCVIFWKNRIPEKSINESFITIMDFLPTFAEIAGFEFQYPVTIDGQSVLDLWLTNRTGNQDRAFYYYYRDQLQAVRKGDWKLFLPLEIKQVAWDRILSEGEGQTIKLVNLRDDLQENQDLSERFPEKVSELINEAEIAKRILGDEEMQGSEQRPAGWIDDAIYLKSTELQYNER